MRSFYLKGYKVFLMASLWLLSNGLLAQSSRYPFSATAIGAVMDTVIAKRMDRYRIPGFAFSIVKDGRIFLSKGYGYSELDNKTAVEADKTIFRIGSITKVFTATAVMQLVDEGKLTLNDEVNKFLWDKISYKNNIPITLHHLLTHSEGFREIPGRRTTSAANILPLREFLKNRLVQDYHAGEIGNYGTYGIALSGLIMEEASGLPYRDYLQKKIFDPLKMTHTNATDISDENKKYFATGYEYINDEYKKMVFEYYHTFPASDINSTVNDMANFMLMHLNRGTFENKAILQPQSSLRMTTTQFRNHPAIVGYTCGLFESTINGTKALYHGGGMDGYASLMYLWPEKNIGLFMTCNVENHNFLNSILNNFLYYFFPAPTSQTNHADEFITSGLERFAGNYQRPAGPKLDISVNPDSSLSFWGGKWIQVQPLLFKVVNGTLDTGEDMIAFKQDAQGKIVWMTTGPFVYFKTENSKNRRPAVSLSKQELNGFTGSYTMNGSTHFIISRVNNKLFVSVNNGTLSELIPTSKTSFFSAENNATIRFENNIIEIDINGTTLTCTKNN